MEKSKNKILKFLPRAASGITFSSGRNNKDAITADKLQSHQSKQISSQNLAIIPVEGSRNSNNSRYEAQEPTSPKISCMGHIKQRKKLDKNMHLLLLNGSKNKPSVMKPVFFLPEANKLPTRMQNGTVNDIKQGRKSDASAGNSVFNDRAPNLSQMKRFASFHGSVANFDWKMAQTGSCDDHINELDEKTERLIVVPFFARTMGGGDVGPVVPVKPRKEINLWKRRSISQPKPIQINNYNMLITTIKR